VAIDLGFAASAAAVAVAAPSGDVVAVLRAEPWSGVPLVLAGAVCGWLAYLVMSPLAVLGEARRLVQRRAGRPH
jgi:hypothetical protein